MWKFTVTVTSKKYKNRTENELSLLKDGILGMTIDIGNNKKKDLPDTS